MQHFGWQFIEVMPVKIKMKYVVRMISYPELWSKICVWGHEKAQCTQGTNKNFEFEKGSRDHNKSKETSS